MDPSTLELSVNINETHNLAHSGGTVFVPAELLRVGLDPFTVTVFVYLASLPCGRSPSSRSMALALSISRKKIEECLGKLMARNMIARTAMPIGGPRYRWTYGVNPTSSWTGALHGLQDAGKPAPDQSSSLEAGYVVVEGDGERSPGDGFAAASLMETAYGVDHRSKCAEQAEILRDLLRTGNTHNDLGIAIRMAVMAFCKQVTPLLTVPEFEDILVGVLKDRIPDCRAGSKGAERLDVITAQATACYQNWMRRESALQ